MDSRITRLDLNSVEASELSEALERVIEQPISVVKGCHANLCYVMSQIFGIRLTKFQAVEGAIYALWREDDLLSIESDDRYINELKQDKAREQYYLEMADTL